MRIVNCNIAFICNKMVLSNHTMFRHPTRKPSLAPCIIDEVVALSLIMEAFSHYCDVIEQVRLLDRGCFTATDCITVIYCRSIAELNRRSVPHQMLINRRDYVI